MSRISFPTPEDAELAFYEAIESGDLDRLMSVWSDDDEIVCIHPNGHRMVGQQQVRESWKAILDSGHSLQVRVTRSVRWQGAMLSIHSVIETLYVDQQPGNVPVAATNVYVRDATGWHLLVHHASALATAGGQSGDPGPSGGKPTVLH